MIGIAQTRRRSRFANPVRARGALDRTKRFLLASLCDTADEELVRSAIEQFYNKDGQPPKELFVPTTLEDTPLIEAWLSEKKGESVRVVTPERGTKHQLLRLAEENAGAAVADHLRDQEIERQAVDELKRLLRLERAPRRIEGFDISNTMGNQSVASMVVWEDGQIKKSDYRKFRIKTVEGANDFASMQEVVVRRYQDVQGIAATGSHHDRRWTRPTRGCSRGVATGRANRSARDRIGKSAR